MATGSEHSRALIAAATRGDLAEVQRLIPISNCTFKGSSAIRLASKNEHNEIVQLLAPHADTRSHNSLIFRNAARQGNMEMLTFLLPLCDPQARNSEALVFAIDGNHKQVFDFLLPLSNITERPDDFITPAASHGRTDMLEILLQQIKPHSSKVLVMPALNGHAQCVEMLLPYCGVDYDNYTPWRWAIHNWRADVVRLMAEHVDVNVFNHLALAAACGNSDQPMIEFLFERSDRDTVLDDLFHHPLLLSHEQRGPVETLLAQEQHQRMTQTIGTGAPSTKKKL